MLIILFMDDYKDSDDRAISRDIVIEELNKGKPKPQEIIDPETEIDPESVQQAIDIIENVKDSHHQSGYIYDLYKLLSNEIEVILSLNDNLNIIEFLISRMGQSSIEKDDFYIVKLLVKIFKTYEDSLCEMVNLCTALIPFLHYKKISLDIIDILTHTINYDETAAEKMVNAKIFDILKMYIHDPYNKEQENRIVKAGQLFALICQKISTIKFQQYLMRALPIMHCLLFYPYLDSKCCSLAAINKAIRLPDAPVCAIVTSAIFEHLVIVRWYGLLTVRIASLLNFLAIVEPDYFYGYVIMQFNFIPQLVDVLTVNPRAISIVMKLLMNCSMVENGAKYLIETEIIEKIYKMSDDFSSSNQVRFFTIVMRAFLSDPNVIKEQPYFTELLSNSSNILCSSILDITADAFFEVLHLLVTKYTDFLENIEKDEILESLSYWEDHGVPEVQEKASTLIAEITKDD